MKNISEISKSIIVVRFPYSLLQRVVKTAFATLAGTLFVSAAYAQQRPVFNATSTHTDAKMHDHFSKPPATARPWVFWMWLNVNTSYEAITKDLEEMHKKGIEGAILYNSGAGSELQSTRAKMVLKGNKYVVTPTQDYKGAYMTALPTEFLKPWDNRSRELFRFASKEAGRLGVKFVLSAGLAGTSGPILPEYGQQELIWSEKDIKGPALFNDTLPAPRQGIAPTFVPLAAVKKGPGKKPSGGLKQSKDRHEIAVLAISQDGESDVSKVINLSGKMDSEGHLNWTVPPGNWKIVRFAYQPTGKKNVWGLFTDGMSREALDTTWNTTIGRVIHEMTPEEKKGLTGVEDDSWEAGETTWTKLFSPEFEHLRNYNLIPWLPALAGIVIRDSAATDGVRRDYYRTIADLIATNHYAHLRDLANKNGLICYSEPAGPNSAQLDLMKDCKGVDMAMGEFWAPSVHRPTPESRFLLRNAANANHIYGKRITACESFTSVGPHWEESFFDLKNTADQAFCDGANLDVIHNFSHSPSVSAKPGYVYFAGTHYGRNVTWWEQTPAFNAYLGRCSYLLQQGLFVADALYYRSDDIGHGESMKTEPALPAPGYDHDNCNLDALLTRVSMKAGRFVLPDGMSYKILVLPDQSKIAPEALEKIAALVNAGGIVVGPRPDGIAGLPGNTTQKTRSYQLLAKLWGNKSGINRVGAGRIIANRTPAEVLHDLHVAPDFEYNGLSAIGNLDWIHRRTNNTDIYFIASRWDPDEKVNCTFRVSGRQPEIWDPVTGETRDVTDFRQANGRTVIPLKFGPRQSVFIVFRKPIASSFNGRGLSNYPTVTTKSILNGKWELHFDPAWGGPAKITIDSLIDWTKFADYNIQHYSGTAIYFKSFYLEALPSAKNKLLLDLGEVHEEASVKVNGKDIGIIWTKPAQIDITRAVHLGENKLEITVVNLWPNRLIGDEPLPANKRFTLTNMHKFNKDTPLYPSGLIGPVKLENARGY